MKKVKNLLKNLGPGFITGASDDDPSGIGTYSQTGAMFGFTQLWLAVFTVPLMYAVQEMCGRIGMVSGKGLAGVIKHHYPKSILYSSVLLLLIANTINIGADLGAMAASAELIFKLPFTIWLLIMVITILILEVFVSYELYAKVLKYLALVLFSYIITAFFVDVPWTEVLIATVKPSIQWNREYLINIVAILGTSISPYLFFWQSYEEVEEEVEHKKLRFFGKGVPRLNWRDFSKMRKDTFIGMIFSQVVMWFIIVTTGATLFTHGIHTVGSAQEAAVALRPFAGEYAYLLFAIGIIGTGLLAVPILSGSASYALAEIFNWKAGLSQKFKTAHGFYGAITIATLVGVGINYIGIDPIQALYLSAVINGIIAPPLLIVILLISNNREIMGNRVNGKWTNVLGITAAAVMSVSAIILLISFVL